MSRLSWKTHFRPETLPPDHVVLLTEHGHCPLTGTAYHQIAPWLDGEHTADEIQAGLVQGGVSSFEALLTLNHLQALGLVRDVDADAETGWGMGEVAFWHALGQDVPTVAGRLAKTEVAVRAVGGADAACLRQALQAARVNLSESEDIRDHLVVVADDYLDPGLKKINDARLRSGSPWVLVKLVGTVPYVGPLFVPGETGCWTCLAQRLALNRQTELVLRERLGPWVKPPTPATTWTTQLAAELAAVEVVRWLATGQNQSLEGTLLALDLKSNSLSHHRLTRRPQCTACGKPRVRGDVASRSMPVPVTFPSASKTASDGGRDRSPEAVLRLFEHHVSPLTGVARALVESWESGYPRVVVPQAFPMYRFDISVLRENLIGRTGGKGLTGAQARASALCEALERYSGIWQGEEEVLASSLADLGRDAVDLASCQGFSPRQYAERDSWNATNDDPHVWIPLPFNDRLIVDWIALWSLTHGRPRFLPAAFCYYGHPDLRHLFCASDSNGCAAGGTLSEAAVSALLELIERDAVAIWWFNRVRRPGVDLDDFRLPLVRELQQHYRDQGRAIWALNLTTDLGISVIVAASARVGRPVEDIILGFAADLDPAAAVAKAALEMHQSHFATALELPDGSTRYRTDRPSMLRWFRQATTAEHPYLVPDPAQPSTKRSDFPRIVCDDWRDELFIVVERLRTAGLEVLVLDQTRPDIGLPVCRSVVPGLCHFWRRFGTRRLFDVPVRMGWLPAPLKEDELNPWNIYF